MSFDRIDSVLYAWAAKNWVQPGATSDAWEVHVWDYHERRRDWWTAAAELESKLTDAYRVARSWVD